MGDQNSQQKIDQRDQDTIAYQNFSGLRSDVDPERFELSDLAVANNCDIDKSGRIARRSGYANIVDTATHSLWASDNLGLAVCVQGTTLFRINSDYSLSILATGLTAAARMSYKRVNDRVYFSNGFQTGVIENGHVRSWGLPVPPLPGVGVTVGNMPAGSYQYVLTYFREDGQESGAGLAGVISVPAGAGLTFILPTPTDPGVVSRGLYLTTPNGDMLYLALTVPISTLVVTYTNDTSELVLPLATQFMGPPPAGQIVGYFRGHTFVGVDSTLYPSTDMNYELFDLRQYIALESRVTLFAALEDKEIYTDGKKSGVFVGTDRSCGVLAGSKPGDFLYVPKTDYGAVEGAVAYVDGSLYGDNATGAKSLPMWLSKQGICVGLPDMEIRNLTRTKYSFTIGSRGAAMFRPGPNRFVAVTST